MASFDPAHFVRNAVLYLVPMILSLTVHEFAHAWVATRLGDDTPEREERLTLSPLAHIDIFGTLLVPLISIATFGAAFIGWAKPVNINPSRFRRGVSMRSGMAIASAAGPLSNLLLVALAVGGLVVLARTPLLAGAPQLREGLANLLNAMALINLGLCIFNLLPIPPLDGSRVLPSRFDNAIEKIRPYSFLIIAAIMMSPVGSVLIGWPIRELQAAIRAVVG